jgi:hypothetical protein
MKIQVNKSKKAMLCIIYHPNPGEIQEQIDKVREILEEVGV